MNRANNILLAAIIFASIGLSAKIYFVMSDKKRDKTANQIINNLPPNEKEAAQKAIKIEASSLIKREFTKDYKVALKEAKMLTAERISDEKAETPQR